MSTSREDFEAWASVGTANLERIDGAYMSSIVAFAWDAWQARDADVEALRQRAEADAVHNLLFNVIAKDLPEGYVIKICAARNAGWVEFTAPNGDRLPTDLTEDSLVGEALRALQDAIDAQRKEQQT